MKKLIAVFLFTLVSAATTWSQSNPVPTLTSINPTSAPAGSASVTITLTGSGFVSGSAGQVNGGAIATTFVSGTQLTAVIPTSYLAAPGLLSITVFSSAPGGGISAPRTFTVLSLVPPIIASLSPSTGRPATTSTGTITGNHLLGTTSVTVSGTGVTVTIASGGSATSLPITISISADAATGVRSVAVTTPAGMSAPCNCFTVIVGGRWEPTGSMAVARSGHSATLLLNGKVLVSGGLGSNAFLGSAELYDPATGTWSPTGFMTLPRYTHTATLLPAGKVLVTGGLSGSPANVTISASAEIYDPSTGGWTTIASMMAARVGHTATLLPNGKVLVAGGANQGIIASAEVYDPQTGNWNPTGPMETARIHHSATLLPDGKVLVAGGRTGQSGDVYLSSTELYNFNTGVWSGTGQLATRRSLHTATLLRDGKVLVAGGIGDNPQFPITCEVFDPTSGAWSEAGRIGIPRRFHTATLLANGRILVAGGITFSVDSVNSAELSNPDQRTWNLTSAMARARDYHTATLLASGKVLVAAGTAVNADAATAELYDPADPSISGISARNGPPGSTFRATLTGANLIGVTAVQFSGTGVTATIGVGGTDESLPITITVAPDATLGARSLTVTTSSGTAQLLASFVVGEVPAISGLSNTPPGLSQTIAPLHGQSFMLTVNGQSFVTSSQIYWGSEPLTTSYVGSTQLTGIVPASLLRSAGTFPIKVSNPGPLDSNVQDFRVVERGDINGNRSVNIGDALVIALTVGGIIKPPLPVTVGDVNLNGTTNIGDALALALFVGRLNIDLNTPSIYALSGNPGFNPGEVLTVSGGPFALKPEDNRVLFTTTGGGIVRVIPTVPTIPTGNLKVTIPSNAVSGAIQVYRLDVPMGGSLFPIPILNAPVPPLLSEVSPMPVRIGQFLSLSGFFPGESEALFTTLTGTVPGETGWHAGIFNRSVKVPEGAVCGPLRVRAGEQMSNAKIVLISGLTCPLQLVAIVGGAGPGEIMVLEGAGFNGATPSANVVKFAASGGGTVNGTVLQAGGTQLQVIVPETAVEGNVTVTVGTQTSNALQYRPP